MSDLLQRWLALTADLCPHEDAESLGYQLLAAWSEPGRAYHDVQHLRECLARLDELALSPSDHEPLELALWFHDAVYDPRASDNEERSADWASEALASYPSVLLVRELILITKHHAEPQTQLEKWMLDIDLCILGANPERFWEYDNAVRQEYAWVSEEAFREGRSKVLRSFLDRPVIYHTPWFESQREEQARANLHAALDRWA